MVNVMMYSFSTQWEHDDVTAFMARTTNLGAAKQEFQKALESIAANIAWRAKNDEALLQWLEEVTA